MLIGTPSLSNPEWRFCSPPVVTGFVTQYDADGETVHLPASITELGREQRFASASRGWRL
jgi:hypothetical protein